MAHEFPPLSGGGRREETHASPSKTSKRTLYLSGEPNGAMHTYSHSETVGSPKEPGVISVQRESGNIDKGMPKSEGGTSWQKLSLARKGEICEVQLDDGSRRTYQKVETLPSSYLGEELNPILSSQVQTPAHYHLTHEVLPNQNHITYTYHSTGHLASICTTHPTNSQEISWIQFNYETHANGVSIHVSTSDKKKLKYDLTPLELAKGETLYALTNISGSHLKPIHFDYEVKNDHCLLVGKKSPEQTLQIDYDAFGKVKSLKEPQGKPGEEYQFTYADNYTEVLDRQGKINRFQFDSNPSATLAQDHEEETGRLIAKSVIDSDGAIQSHKVYQYDAEGNLLEEKTYLKLLGEETELNPESKKTELKTYAYTKDGHLLANELTYENGQLIKKLPLSSMPILPKGMTSSKQWIQ